MQPDQAEPIHAPHPGEPGAPQRTDELIQLAMLCLLLYGAPLLARGHGVLPIGFLYLFTIAEFQQGGLGQSEGITPAVLTGLALGLVGMAALATHVVREARGCRRGRTTMAGASVFALGLSIVVTSFWAEIPLVTWVTAIPFAAVAEKLIGKTKE